MASIDFAVFTDVERGFYTQMMYLTLALLYLEH